MITANKVEVKESSIHGFGVFAKEDIEESLVLLTNIKSEDTLYGFNDYFWSEDGKYVISLGLASIFNNDENNPNCIKEVYLEERMYRFRTLRKIRAGEELLISYR
jgi:SET domain-containing protein